MTRIEAVEEALLFMETIVPDKNLSLDEFLCEYDRFMNAEERAWGQELLDTILDECNDYKESLVNLIKKYPNDADLGENVRKLYNR
tara:strand:- start:295 stop:552 length:258 start_codon:yes stop_codon:yes gene_type:complete